MLYSNSLNGKYPAKFALPVFIVEHMKEEGSHVTAWYMSRRFDGRGMELLFSISAALASSVKVVKSLSRNSFAA